MIQVCKAKGQVSEASEEALIQAGRDAIARSFAEEGICTDLWSHVLQERVIGPREWRDRCARVRKFWLYDVHQAHFLIFKQVKAERKTATTQQHAAVHITIGLLAAPAHRYSIEHGAVFGLAHGLTQLAYFRPGANSTGRSGRLFQRWVTPGFKRVTFEMIP